MSAPSCFRILAASAVMLGAIVFVIVDQNYMSGPRAVQEAVPIKGDSLLQAAAVSKSAVDCKLTESPAYTSKAADGGSESLFYMESLIPLLGFAFCIPLRRLWLSLQDNQDGDDQKVQGVTGELSAYVAPAGASPIAVESQALSEVDDSLAEVFRESRCAFQETLQELDEELSGVPVTFTRSGAKGAGNQQAEASLDWAALASAASSGDVATFEELIADCGPNAKDTWGVSLLHTAVLGGSESITKSLLQRGADHSATDLWDDAPLHYAARGGCSKVCQVLLDAGAQSTKNAQDWTPLFVAAHAGHEEACKLFFDKGFEVGASDCELPPLLHGLFVDKLIAGLLRTPVLRTLDDEEGLPYEVSAAEAPSEKE